MKSEHTTQKHPQQGTIIIVPHSYALSILLNLSLIRHLLWSYSSTFLEGDKGTIIWVYLLVKNQVVTQTLQLKKR